MNEFRFSIKRNFDLANQEAIVEIALTPKEIDDLIDARRLYNLENFVWSRLQAEYGAQDRELYTEVLCDIVNGVIGLVDDEWDESDAVDEIIIKESKALCNILKSEGSTCSWLLDDVRGE